MFQPRVPRFMRGTPRALQSQVEQHLGARAPEHSYGVEAVQAGAVQGRR